MSIWVLLLGGDTFVPLYSFIAFGEKDFRKSAWVCNLAVTAVSLEIERYIRSGMDNSHVNGLFVCLCSVECY